MAMVVVIPCPLVRPSLFPWQSLNTANHPQGYPNGLANPHPHPPQPYSQTPTNHAPTPRKPDPNLDGMNALLQAAGEIVNRRPAP